MYIFAAACASFFLPLPESVKGVLAQPALLLIPYLVGKPLLYFTRRILSIKEANDFAIDALVSWLLGTMFMVTIEAFLYVNYLFFLDSFTIITLIIGLPSIFISDNNSSNSLRHWGVAAVAVYALMFSLFVTHFWPYPYTNDNDIITHTFFVTRIITQNRPLIFYGDYLPTMHTVYAVMMRLFNISPYKEPLYLLWASRFILYPVYGIGLYLFAHQVSKNRVMALLAATIGISLVSMFNGCIFPYHTAPKNFIDLLIIYGLYAATYFYQKTSQQIKMFPSLVGVGIILLFVVIPLYFTSVNGLIGYEIGFILPLLLIIVLLVPRFLGNNYRNFCLSLSIVVVGLVFMAKMQGFQAAGVILAYMFFNWFISKLGRRKAQIMVIFFAGLMLTVFVLFQFSIIPYPTESLILPDPQGAGYFSWDRLVQYLNYIYPGVLLFLFAAGCIFALFSNSVSTKYHSIVMVALLILLAYFLPINYSFRFLGDAHPFIMVLVAFAIVRLLRIDGINIRQNMAILPLFLMMAFVGVNIFTNDMEIFPRGEPYLYNKDTFQIINVGEYIKNHINKDSKIIECQFYQQLQAFYGGVDVTFLWKGGLIYKTDVMDIYAAETAEEAYNKAKEFLNNQEQVVRYADKDGKEIERFFQPPSDVYILCDDDLLQSKVGPDKVTKFSDLRYFDLVFVTTSSNKNNFYLFRVKPEPDITMENGPNLVNNPSFENGADPSTKNPVFWKQVWEQRWIGEIDNQVKAEGNASYRMQTDVTEPQTWGHLKSDGIQVQSGKVYIISASIKTENAMRTYVEIDFINKTNGKWTAISSLIGPQPNQEWKTYAKYIRIPDGVSEVNILCVGGWVNDKSKGTAKSWFDDIELIGPIGVAAIN